MVVAGQGQGLFFKLLPSFSIITSSSEAAESRSNHTKRQHIKLERMQGKPDEMFSMCVCV